MVKENQVTPDSKDGSLVELKGGVLSQVTKLKTDQERCEGRLVGCDIILGPVDAHKQVGSCQSHNGGMR